MSLRARLIAGLLALAAIGLLLAGGITYAEQRSFLMERVDQQVRDAAPTVDRALDERGFDVPGTQQPGDVAGRGGDGGHGFGPGPGLPAGTYGLRRDASGHTLGHVVPYSQASLPPPRIPARLAVGRITTVGTASDDERYRILALATHDQPGITVTAVPLHDAEQTLHRLLLVEGLVVAGVLAALAGLTWLLVRLGLRPLDRIGETAGAIAAGDLSRRVSPATPRTEVGRLGLALNAMLARLESAFAERQASEERLRRFLADASHELRTPLSSIRGYAELFRIGAARDPADTDKAMRRIEEEAARMGVLVEDLLTLARLDEVRDVASEDVDLARIAGDAVDDARVTAPERAIELHAERTATVLGDSHMLRQVLANLLRNAIVHTPEGTPVEVIVRRDADADAVELEVRDHGGGLPGDDPDALFARFSRSEAARGRGRGPAGAGLGLAIVAGIVSAHGGTVRAANAANGGARFVVRLPAAGAPRDVRPRAPGRLRAAP